MDRDQHVSQVPGKPRRHHARPERRRLDRNIGHAATRQLARERCDLTESDDRRTGDLERSAARVGRRQRGRRGAGAVLAGHERGAPLAGRGDESAGLDRLGEQLREVFRVEVVPERGPCQAGRGERPLGPPVIGRHQEARIRFREEGRVDDVSHPRRFRRGDGGSVLLDSPSREIDRVGAHEQKPIGAREGGRQRFRIVEVGAAHVDALLRDIGEPVRVARGRHKAVPPGVREKSDNPTAEVSRSAGDEKRPDLSHGPFPPGFVAFYFTSRANEADVDSHTRKAMARWQLEAAIPDPRGSCGPVRIQTVAGNRAVRHRGARAAARFGWRQEFVDGAPRSA